MNAAYEFEMNKGGGRKNWIKKWDLRIPLELYWGDTNTFLVEKDERDRKRSPRKENEQIEKRTIETAKDISPLFDDADFIPFLQNMRKAVRDQQDKRKDDNSKASQQDIFSVAQQHMRLSTDDLQRLKVSYEHLTLAFLPLAIQVARWRANHSSYMDYDDWQGTAGVILTKTIPTFQWELFQIDPNYATDLFRARLAKAIQDPHKEHFDTRTLEVGHRDIAVYSRYDTTEREALASLEEEEVNMIISSYTSTPQQAEIVRLKIYENLDGKAIAERLGLRQHNVNKELVVFRENVASSKHGQELGVVGENGEQKERQTFWDDLFANIDKYKARFELNRDRLSPYRKKLLDTFFAVQNGDKHESLQAVSDQLDGTAWHTARRQVQATINFLNNREEKTISKTQSEKLWTKAQVRTQLEQLLRRNPEYLATVLTERQQIIAVRWFIDGVTQTLIATELDIHISRVSREIQKIQMTLLRYFGSTAAKPALLNKSRLHLD
jgi:RNA polymerase sigma factor (sigma-70 family)